MSTEKSGAAAHRSEARRQQVLDAAADCFRREGFHGSSIARISKLAGMSPGHIYHYFQNKEVIVEAIAQREENFMAELLHKLEQDQGGGSASEMLTRYTGEILEHIRAPAYVGLMLELTAEASRNPAVWEILHRSDQMIAAQFLALFERSLKIAGFDPDDLRRRLEMIGALFHGLMLRTEAYPAVGSADMVGLLNEVIQFILKDYDDEQ